MDTENKDSIQSISLSKAFNSLKQKTFESIYTPSVSAFTKINSPNYDLPNEHMSSSEIQIPSFIHATRKEQYQPSIYSPDTSNNTLGKGSIKDKCIDTNSSSTKSLESDLKKIILYKQNVDFEGFKNAIRSATSELDLQKIALSLPVCKILPNGSALVDYILLETEALILKYCYVPNSVISEQLDNFFHKSSMISHESSFHYKYNYPKLKNTPKNDSIQLSSPVKLSNLSNEKTQCLAFKDFVVDHRACVKQNLITNTNTNKNNLPQYNDPTQNNNSPQRNNKRKLSFEDNNNSVKRQKRDDISWTTISKILSNSSSFLWKVTGKLPVLVFYAESTHPMQIAKQEFATPFLDIDEYIIFRCARSRTEESGEYKPALQNSSLIFNLRKLSTNEEGFAVLPKEYLHNREKNALIVIQKAPHEKVIIILQIMKMRSDAGLLNKVSHRSVEEGKEFIQQSFKRSDIEIESVKTSLSTLDSYSRKIMRLPCRSILCSHIEVFELKTWLSFPRIEHPHCPVCFKKINEKDIYIDDYFLQILKSASSKNGEFLSLYLSTK